jgi:hypothetical protein
MYLLAVAAFLPNRNCSTAFYNGLFKKLARCRALPAFIQLWENRFNTGVIYNTAIRCFAARRRTTLGFRIWGVYEKLRAEDAERCYLVTDRAVYTSGEDLWFRAFLVLEASQRLSTGSESLIVDLVDDKDQLITQVLLNSGHQPSAGQKQ